MSQRRPYETFPYPTLKNHVSFSRDSLYITYLDQGNWQNGKIEGKPPSQLSINAVVLEYSGEATKDMTGWFQSEEGDWFAEHVQHGMSLLSICQSVICCLACVDPIDLPYRNTTRLQLYFWAYLTTWSNHIIKDHTKTKTSLSEPKHDQVSRNQNKPDTWVQSPSLTKLWKKKIK